MPTLNLPTGATPSLLSLLTPVAAQPIAPVSAADPGGFAELIAGIAPMPMMLDAPPAAIPPTPPILPATGSFLPPALPVVADVADPLPDVDVAQVMVGCGWQPETRLPAIDATPKLELPDGVPTEPPVIDGAAPPAPATAVTKRLPALTASVSPIIGRILAQPTGPRLQPLDDPDAVDEGVGAASPPLPVTPIVVDVPPPIATPVPVPVPVTASFPAPVEVPVEAGSAPVTSIVAPAVSASAEPAVADARPSAPGEPAPQPHQSFEQSRQQQQQPSQPAPSTLAAPAADARITPELARQVAQIIQPLQTAPSETPAVAVPVEALSPTAPVAAPSPQPVAAPAPIQSPQLAQPAALDLGRAEWMQAMIDRIAELPQAADGRREAQIRLLPDALGAVEVTVTESGEMMHVTLNADTPQARLLLSDAAPRLQELAEARGLRFAQPEVGGGSPQDRRQAPDQQSQTSLRPRSAAADREGDPSEDAERIA